MNTSARTTEAPDYCIALQPICNRKKQHVADELLYRSSQLSSSSHFSDPMVATARSITTAMYEIGLDQLVGRRTLFFNAPNQWLDKPELLPPKQERLVIEVQNDVRIDRKLINNLEQLKNQGYMLALDHFQLSDTTRPLLDLADIIKIDLITSSPEQLDLSAYDRSRTKLLAERIENPGTFDYCLQLGFDYFQGFFLARPASVNGSDKHRSNNQNAEIRILRELQEQEPSYAKLEEYLAQDPQLCLLLMRYINSSAVRNKQTITNIRQALSMMGLDRMRSLVMTLMLAGTGAGNRLLMLMTLTRAAMCRKLSEGMHLDASSAFMLGMLSRMDAFMAMPMDKLLREIPLDPALASALLQREGDYGKLLKLVEAFENGALEKKSVALTGKLNQVYLSSRSWANELMEQVS
ncbi:EAL and HDOD domain-containing protein [Marinospirillum alkaliphilum]|uniref:EAL and modified HD-GYP domain-containing signal transduction protein n=1 Tax=Marinospirillum alkaliphilum DSM 21637 TaxID=1122209 RepID=A0A1K1W4I2_9GAMM|nr:HDOD domain-containing protein [Marinospirillum alkaliphilum]SFX31844.1 EAL and modified HD-GYP domain-containing signal transduction protein [Marinospirillum alkaliphilum DSM 21637]